MVFRNEATFAAAGNTLSVSGTSTLTAANGDQVYSTFAGSGTLSSPVPSVGATDDLTLVFTITGGTGRFGDASGSVTVRLHQEVVSLAGATLVLHDTGSLEGRISY